MSKATDEPRVQVATVAAGAKTAECPNCGSEQHHAWYLEPTRYGGHLTGDPEDQFAFLSSGDIDPNGAGGGKFEQYRCAGCEMVLVPFVVDDELHVRALDDQDADNLRFQSDVEIAAAHRAGWEDYRAVTEGIEKRAWEMIRRAVRKIAPAATHIALEPDDQTGEEWRLLHAMSVPLGEAPDPQKHALTDDEADELASDDVLVGLLADYSVRGGIDGINTLALDPDIAKKVMRKQGR